MLGSRIQFILEQVLLRNFMGPREHQVSPDILEYKFFETHQVKHLSPIHKFYLTSGSLDTYKALGFVVDIKFKTKFPHTHTHMSPWLYFKALRGSLANATWSRNDRTDFPQASARLFIPFLGKEKKKLTPCIINKEVPWNCIPQLKGQ